jgi:hypothetical protein
MHRRLGNAARLLGALLLPPLCAAPLAAQGTGWDVKAEASASLYFGNTRQSTFGTRLSAAQTDSSRELRSVTEFTYGEAETPERRMFVSKRSWRSALTADYRPFARVSPFALASAESSFEKRIDSRYAAGLGAKYLFVRSEQTASDLSLAVLAERSRLSGATGATTEETLARYSARYRLDRKFSDKVSLAHETYYRPEVRELDRFTFTSRTAVAYKVATRLALQASFLDNYDSEARERGARSNNDGELLFGMAATF